MIKVSIIYPNEEGSRFDHDYYKTTHMPLVVRHLGPRGLIKIGIEKGVAGGAPGEKPPYHCIGGLFFESETAYRSAAEGVGSVLRDDVPKFTDVAAIRQISEVVE
ncbi:MAG: EthD family reductase [bacterium]